MKTNQMLLAYQGKEPDTSAKSYRGDVKYVQVLDIKFGKQGIITKVRKL